MTEINPEKDKEERIKKMKEYMENFKKQEQKEKKEKKENPIPNFIPTDGKSVIEIIKNNPDNPLHKLNPDNYIIKNLSYMATQYDGYGDWNLAGALQNLSIIADKKLRVKLKQMTINPNIWILSIAPTTLSRKTTGMQNHESFHIGLGINHQKMLESFSPERFFEEMSINSHRYFWKDECVETLAGMAKKSHMAGFRDMLCDFYEGVDRKRGLRTSLKGDKKTEFEVINPYLILWWMTTPESFKMYTTPIDILSGWLLRFLTFAPEGEKAWMGFEPRCDEDKRGWNELFNMLVSKRRMIDSSPLIEMRLTDDAWTFFREWQERREKEIISGPNPMYGSMFSRLENYVFKLAMLFCLGDPEFKTVGNDKYIGQNMSYIEKTYIEVACEMIDKIFFPYTIKVLGMVEECKEMELIKKVRDYIYKYRKVTKADILRNVRFPTKLITPAIAHLTESMEIADNVDMKTGTTYFYSPDEYNKTFNKGK